MKVAAEAMLKTNGLGATFDGAERSICCFSLTTNKKAILRFALDDLTGCSSAAASLGRMPVTW
jgi:hypothetical protein